MAPSDEQTARPNRSEAPKGDSDEPSHSESGSRSTSFPFNAPMAPKSGERGRPTHRNQRRNRSGGGLSAPLRESQDASERRDLSNSQTCTACPEPHNADEPGGDQSTASDPGHQSSWSMSANSNDNRDQGFRLEDLVTDVFLTQQRPCLEDTPVYRVVSWLPEYSAYRLQLYHDPGGRAPLWNLRNWAEIRLYNNAVADRRSEEVD